MGTIIDKLREILNVSQSAVFVTIIHSSGSTPRGVGASMIVTKDGRVFGTVGGGAIEHRCEMKALEVLGTKSSCTEHYLLHENEIQDLGMICGGEVSASFDYVERGDDTVIKVLAQREKQYKKVGIVYIFGGGHISQALVPVLASVDFECVVLEDREEFCNLELFPGASQAILIDNSKVDDYVTLNKDDYAVIVTRGHKDDQKIQAQVLKSPVGYIGVIGSKRKAAKVLDNLREMGFSGEDLSRVISPIGLDIGGETPAEIAISIAAQLISVRAERGG